MGCLISRPQFDKEFNLGEKVGSGHFADVHICREKGTHVRYAVKIIDKEHLLNSDALEDEVEVLRKVENHRNVLNLYKTYENRHAFFIITDYCAGGDLFGRIVDEGHCSEQRAVDIMYQLASAIQHIHNCGVTHRDLKPENILLTTEDRNARIKVADFGLSKIKKGGNEIMRTFCGTWAYCAPEVIQRKPYTNLVDNWTLGVLMYIVLCGYHPFDMFGDAAEAELLQKIEGCDYDFKDDAWDHVSEEAQEIVSRLIVKDPDERMTTQELLETNWINGKVNVKNETNEKALKHLSTLVSIRKQIRVTGLTTLAAGKFKTNLKKFRRKSASEKSSSQSQSPSDKKKSDLSEINANKNAKVAWNQIVPITDNKKVEESEP